MSSADFSEMSVVDLRKYAKEHGIVLGAGLNKAGIIAKLEAADQDEEMPSPAPAPAPTPEPVPAPVAAPARAEPDQRPSAQPTFRAAWHNPSNRYGNTRPGYGGGVSRQSFGNPPPEGSTFRPVAPQAPAESPARPQSSFTPRFGPGAAVQPAAKPEPSVTPWHETEVQPPVQSQPPQQRREQPVLAPEPAPRKETQQNDALSPQAYLTAEDLKDASGFLEMHPDGYAFLRGSNLLSSGSDIYVAPSQIKRYGLREGDYVVGRVRPQREGDKYSALLTVTSLNGQAPASQASRPAFDAMTAVYPTRRLGIDLTRTTRVLDLIAPMGFGQRTLLLCQPETGKAALLRDLANAIREHHPEAKVSVLLLDVTPEDATEFRDQVKCEVLATTFDQNPENHLRMTDLALERAERQCEMGQDVVLFVDSLTKLSKTCTIAAAQQGRATPGMVNPSSLYRARKLFGAARALREGGSLTVIGCLNVQTGNKVDDSIVEEFREAANCVVTLDGTLARVGIEPPVAWHQSGTRRSEQFLDQNRQESLRLLKQELESMSDSAAIRQLADLTDRTPDNESLCAKLPDLISLMQGKR